MSIDPTYVAADTLGVLRRAAQLGSAVAISPPHPLPGPRWVRCRARMAAGIHRAFYLPVHALSAIFGGRFRDAMDAAGLLGEIPSTVWNVNCQAVGSGHASLQYLAGYVFSVAISDSRIACVGDSHVVFRYRRPHSNRLRTLRLPIFEFMHRFLQHVLPRGFMKVRYYGLLSPSFAMPLVEIKARVELAQGFARQENDAAIERPVAPAPLCCRHCGGRLRYERTILPLRTRVSFAHRLAPTVASAASG